MVFSIVIALFVMIAVAILNRKSIFTFLEHRQMYAKLPTVEEIAYPIIGHSYLFVGSNEKLMQKLFDMFHRFAVNTKEKLSVLWMGPIPSIILFHPKAAEVLLKSSKNIRKGFIYEFLHPWLGTGLLTSHGEKWKQRRRLITPSFHFSILQQYLVVMNNQSAVFINKLKSQMNLNQHVDVGKAITMCALDIICETAMGQTVNAQKNEDSDYVKNLHRITDLILLRQKTPFLWSDFLFKKLKVGIEHDQVVDIIQCFTKNVIQSRMKTRNDRTKISQRLAFLDILLHARTEDGQELSLNDIQEEVDTFMFEGHDTTSAAMTWATYLIGCHPDIQERIHEELYMVFGDDKNRPASMEDLRKLQYLEQVIKESLRLFPSVPMYARVTTEECQIDGHIIPKGAQVAVFVYGIHHSPEVWDNPETFDPDQFTKENSAGRHPYAYIPFSAGPRNCIGQRFALLEEKVMLSTLLRNFEVVSLDNKKDIAISGDLILRSAKPLNFSLKERI